MGMFFNEDINTLFVGDSAVSAVYVGSEQIYPVGLPSGTVFNFEYTGNVQSVELPKGKYKLQCWGAQGGTSYGSSNGAGSKGGYSEGVITLTETTTFYVFVGGQGSNGKTSSLVNGGWNGGGASVGYSSYNSGDTYGYSYPACGGGATDISTVTSSMSYSSGRTNRSSASLLARCIVAGGGAGGSYRYTEVTKTSTTSSTIYLGSISGNYYDSANGHTSFRFEFEVGKTYMLDSGGAATKMTAYNSSYSAATTFYDNSPETITAARSIILAYGSSKIETIDVYEIVEDTTTNTSTSSGYSNKSQQGGGTSGKGQYPGTQTSAGSGGGFGYGANQASTNYRYCGGAAGGGWYGGGTGQSDSSTSYVNYSGGGSGFVNTAANASSRPSGYTGLQLDNGSTKDGATSFESTSGGTETGHSGNGYARITVIE